MSRSETFELTYTYTDPGSDPPEDITISGVTVSYPNEDVGPIVATSAQLKGDGYYGRSDGFHTIQYNTSGFIGSIKVQATLAVNPSNADWFDIYTENYLDSSEDGTTGSFITNFTGNYVWIRTVVNAWTDGTINSIRLNH